MDDTERAAGRVHLRFDMGLVLPFLVVLALVAGFAALVAPGVRQAERKRRCVENLAEIGRLLAELRRDGEWSPEVGPAYLLQVAARIEADGDLGCFACPCDESLSSDLSRLVDQVRADWRRAPCSYWGPDDPARTGDGRPVILAACTHHAAGVVVLWEAGNPGFIEWRDVEGSDGAPIPLGPGCADPRFRHLVR